MPYPYHLPPVDDLTAAQLDGWGCVYCGDRDGLMRPVGRLREVLMFAHDECALSQRIEE